MATKRTSSSPSRTRRRSAKRSREPIAARALQSLILILGVLLLSSFLFGRRWGPAMVGVLIFASAFPPARRHVDRWLVGKVRGNEADQAAVIRMVAGITVTIVAALNLFPL